jgi:hypothetical protein
MSVEKKMISKLLSVVLFLCSYQVNAQTDNDAIMMKKNQWCNGATYMHSHWKDYWEGKLKRNNENFGTVTTQSVMYMTNYGITDNLNVLAGASYVWTHASAGTRHGYKGLQDLSLFVKWKPVTLSVAKGKLSLFAIGGLSTPLTNYPIDELPLSIGLGSTNLSGRLMADYQQGIFFTTISGAYIWRSNVKLDKTSYYTTDIHYTNEVEMPDMANFNFSIGIRKKYLVATALLDNTTTLGGFDMRRNDMPSPGNRMNSTSVGIHAKYTLPFYTHVELLGGGSYVLTGRNVGQTLSFHVGGYYIFSFKNKNSKTN